MSAERLVNLAQQWEKHRVPLIEQYRELKQMNANRVVSTGGRLLRTLLDLICLPPGGKM